MLEYDTITCTYEGVLYRNYPEHRCIVIINDSYLTYHLFYNYQLFLGLTDDTAQLQLAEGFAYIIENHIDRANGNIVQQLYDLFDAYGYPFRDISAELSYSTISKIYIDFGDRNDFLAFIERLKQEDTLPGMPTETELLQFLSKGDD